jgi:hypothetical protein
MSTVEVGQRFGSWTVVLVDPTGKRGTVICQCSTSARTARNFLDDAVVDRLVDDDEVEAIKKAVSRYSLCGAKLHTGTYLENSAIPNSLTQLTGARTAASGGLIVATTTGKNKHSSEKAQEARLTALDRPAVMAPYLGEPKPPPGPYYRRAGQDQLWDNYP